MKLFKRKEAENLYLLSLFKKEKKGFWLMSLLKCSQNVEII